jgi:dolichyl-phosphate-mannose--protein O-mannosyl transferase
MQLKKLLWIFVPILGLLELFLLIFTMAAYYLFVRMMLDEDMFTKQLINYIRND